MKKLGQGIICRAKDTRLHATLKTVKNTCVSITGVLLLLLLSLPVHLLAQNGNIKFERIQAVQGQRLRTIRSLQQDSQGFMWFGTEVGLYKYDGYGLTVYKHDRLDSTSLGNSLVFTIHEDRSGALWIGTAGGGLNRFDREHESFTRFVNNPENPNSLSDNVVSAIYEDRSGTLWAGTWSGLHKLDRNTGQFTRFVHEPGEPLNVEHPYWTWSIYEDSVGTLWVGTREGLSRLDRDTGQLTHFGLRNEHSLDDLYVSSILEDRAGALWIGTLDGLHRFDREQEQFTHFVHNPANPHSLSSNAVLSIFEDRTGTLWIGTGGGLNTLDRDKGDFTRFVHDPANPYSLSSNHVLSIFEDHTGTLWIGTVDGVNRLDREQQRFGHFVHDPDNPHSLSHEFVGAIHEDSTSRNTLWVGTADGLDRIDRDTGQFRHFVHDPENPRSLTGNFISSILEDHTGALWVGTSDGLNLLDRDKGDFTRFVHDPANPHSLSSNSVRAIQEDLTGKLWIGTSDGGLNRFEPDTGKFTRFAHDPDNPHSLGYIGVWAMHATRSGRLWIATNGGGISLYDREREQFTRFAHDFDNPRNESDDWVGAVFEDRAGTLWSTTWYAGLNKLDRDTGLFTTYTEKNGMASNQIYSIAGDERGHLWLGTHNGLSRFDPQSETFINFDVDDGLLSNRFSQNSPNACVKSQSGELFFGGTRGIDYFHPDSIRNNPHIPPVVITRFTRYKRGDGDGKPIVDRGISEKQHLELSYQDRILSFEFAALNFRNSRKNQYAYKLEGFNQGWIQLGSKHDVTFTNLDPGEYTLRVKGSNNDGVWNEEGASLGITIIPPWWRTRWAYGSYVLLFVAALYGIRHYELRRLQLRNELKIRKVEAEKLQEVDRLKSRFFASISHEFRTPLTLILGPVEKWLAGIRQPEMKRDFHIVQRNARRLQQLINQLLDLSKLESGKMSLQARPENIVELIRMNTMTFESLAKQKGIDLQFHAPEEEIIAFVERDKLEKIVMNLLSNAFKFTADKGKVAVAVEKNELPTATATGFLEIRISDTGVGIPEDQLDKVFDRFHQADNNGNHDGAGIGLALTKELVELHHGEISVESEVGKGTSFTVRLRLGKAHLKPEEIVEREAWSEERSAESEEQRVKYPQPLALSAQQIFSNEQQMTMNDEVQMTAKSNDNEVILIVDDNADMRAYLRGYLEASYRIVEAEDGAQGVKQANKHAPDLIISDVMMPEMDGFELCEKLKTDARTSHIPVILLTARASGESKVEGLETGADDYLTKPFDVKELQVRVKNLIEQRRRLRERFRRELLIQPSEVTVTSMDAAFLKKVMAAVEAHIDDPSFDTDDLARESAIGRRQLNRKLRALTGQSVRGFIRTIRLKHAAHLLQQQAGTVTEIAYDVGFNSIAHFAKIFREEFGVAPSEYGKNG